MSSDFGRKDTSDKVKEAIVPDAMKSDTTRMKESGTGILDNTVREAQPDSSKSGTQETMDKFGRGKDNTAHGSTHDSMLDKAKHAVGLDKKDHTTTHSTH